MLAEYQDILDNQLAFQPGKVFKILFDSTVREFKLIVKTWSILEEIREAFSAPNSAAFFVSRYGYKTENKLYAINKFGYFQPGLLFEVLKWIKLNFQELACVEIGPGAKRYILDWLTPLKTELSKIEKFELSNIADDLGRNNELRRLGKPVFEFRDYQEDSIRHLLTKGYGRGLIEIPTAGGKSFILANFIWNIHKNFNKNYKYLILVPNKQLVEQFYKDLIDYGFNSRNVTRFTAGLKGRDKFDPEAQVIIGNRQYIFLHKQQLPKIDVLICDEAHTVLSEASREFVNNLNCKIKIGCSGTLPRDKMQKWNLIGMFSNIVYQKDIVALQNAGFISKLKITLLKITDTAVENNRKLLFHTHSEIRYHQDEYGYSDIAFDDAYKAEHEYFEQHYKELYAPVFTYLGSLSTNTLILFDRIEIGKNLYEYAKELYSLQKKVFYIDGSIQIDDREHTREAFEKDDGNLLLAQSSIFSTGINIKRLTNIVFLTSSKSFSRVVQSIGRTLRLHQSKTEAHLIDVSWNFKYSQKHLSERLKIYKEMYNKSPDKILKYEI